MLVVNHLKVVFFATKIGQLPETPKDIININPNYLIYLFAPSDATCKFPHVIIINLMVGDYNKVYIYIYIILYIYIYICEKLALVDMIDLFIL